MSRAMLRIHVKSTWPYRSVRQVKVGSRVLKGVKTGVVSFCLFKSSLAAVPGRMEARLEDPGVPKSLDTYCGTGYGYH